MRNILLLGIIIVVVLRIFTSVNYSLEGKHIRLSGILMTEPREYGTSLLVTLRDYSFFVSRDENISFHSKLVVEGVVKEHNLEKVKVISVTPPTSLLSKIRSRILGTIKKTLPEPESSLIAGITIGAPNIPTSFNEILRATGTSHVVVASGGNLAILAGFLEEFLSRFIKRRLFMPIIALVLIIYSAMTGFGAPIVRALVMWLAIMVAQLSGRLVKPLYVLILTICLMLLYKPLWIFDVSFQLSIGATVGIMLLSKPIERKVKRLGIIKEAFATSLSAQVGILPVSISVFHDIKILAPVWNVLVLWVVPYLTILGIIAGLLTLIIEPIGKVVFLFSYPFSWYFVRIVSLF